VKECSANWRTLADVGREQDSMESGSNAVWPAPGAAGYLRADEPRRDAAVLSVQV
jgi:hypothetical protein